jgi:predicted transposase YdaD
MDGLQDFNGSPELKADLEAITAKRPSLEGRLETGEQLKKLQQRFAESAAARGVDLEQISQNAFEEMHPGGIRRD